MWQPPEHDHKAELRDHLSVEGWREPVAEICARHGIADDQLAPFATGSDIVWSAGEWVVKLTAPRWREELASEARCLNHVAGRLDVATPAVHSTGDLGGWPYIVMSRVDGVALATIWPGLGHAERLRMAGELGRLTRALHTIEPWSEPHDWVDFWARCTSDVGRRHAVEGVPSELADQVDPLLAQVGTLDDSSRVFLHTELLDQHVLVTERDGRFELCALLDFADSRIGPAEYDFAAPVEFIFKGEAGLLRAFLVAYGTPDHELGPERSESMLAWALCHQFGSLRRMLQVVAPARPSSLRELAATLYGLQDGKTALR